MAEDNGNPFTEELTNHPSVEAQPADGNPFGDPQLTSAEQAQADTGQATNDVGNTVIVPKEGETFADTMQRAATQGKQTTPEQVNAEEATMPKKVAEVLAAAPGIGAGGAAALAGVGEGTAVLKHIADTYGPVAVKAIGDAAQAHPIVAKLLTHALETAGGLSLVKYFKLLGK